MASNYPTSIDSFTDPLVNSPLNSPSHAGLHTDVNDAVEKIETKVGIGASPAASALSGSRLVANGSGSSSWQRDGVCTSSTRPASPYSGQEIYETDTNLKYVWNGSAWYLIGGGTAVANSGLVYVGSVNLGGSATVLDSCFTSAYTNYRIELNANLSTNGAIDFNFRSGGSDITSLNYRFLYTTQQVDASTSTSPSTLAGWNNGNAYLTNAANAGSNTSSTSWEVFSPQLATKTTWTFQTTFEWSGPSIYHRTGAGSYNGTTQFDGFKLLSAVTMSGTVRVYGYRQA